MVQLIADGKVDLHVRETLVDYLREPAHSVAVPDLQQLYADASTEQELKEEIARTLYVLGDRAVPIDTGKILKEARVFDSVERYIVDQMDVSRQLQVLADTNIALAVRRGIANVLANSGDTSVVPELCTLAGNRKLHVEVRKSIIETLEKIADDRGTVVELVELMNGDKQVRDEAVRALWFVSRRARVRVVADEMTRRVMVGG